MSVHACTCMLVLVFAVLQLDCMVADVCERAFAYSPYSVSSNVSALAWSARQVPQDSELGALREEQSDPDG
jgi:hypothetical protein